MSEDTPDYEISKNTDRPESLTQRLAAEMGWGTWVIDIAVRANFRCEYCDRDLLSSPDAYKEWQHDHIVPQSDEGKDESNNMALSCRTCNVNFKGQWNPNDALSGNPSREDRVAAVRQYVAKKRTVAFAEIIKVREIVYGT